jgi:ABC-type transport system involved in multi-copper enzyme maturation permease subunit
MIQSMHRIRSLAKIIFLDGMRRHALIGLVILSLVAEASGMLFMDFFGRDVGRASSDFLFSAMWLAGLIFLLFHAVQVIAWDEERGTIYALLSRPISRAEYVLGVFSGLATLLFSLHGLLGCVAFGTLLWIKHGLASVYFPVLSVPHFLLAWAGLVGMQMVILAAIMLFSGLVRGGFPVLLLSAAYYGICSGLPVVRASIRHQLELGADVGGLGILLQAMTAAFPDLGRLDFKDAVVTIQSRIEPLDAGMAFAVAALYIALVITFACRLYARRDLN